MQSIEKDEHMSCQLKYLKQSKEYLPDSRDNVSLLISSWTKALVNHEVKKVPAVPAEEINQQINLANIFSIVHYSGD